MAEAEVKKQVRRTKRKAQQEATQEVASSVSGEVKEASNTKATPGVQRLDNGFVIVTR